MLDSETVVVMVEMVDIDDEDSSDVDTELDEYALDVVEDVEVAVVIALVVVVDIGIKPLRVRGLIFKVITCFSSAYSRMSYYN